MAVPGKLTELQGEWRGTNRLWLSPDDPAQESESSAEINFAAGERFAHFRYTWAYLGKPQEGLLLIGQDPKSAVVSGVWIDSWHMGDKIMLCEGMADTDGKTWVSGSYKAPPGPDWGWKITIEIQKDDRFRTLMHNISPDGVEMLAVETAYTRSMA